VILEGLVESIEERSRVFLAKRLDLEPAGSDGGGGSSSSSTAIS
jgi:hypothetical protein